MRSHRALFALTALLMSVGSTLAADPDVARPGLINEAEWQAYRDNFVSDEGRVIDDANGGISHSESQGYGLILAHMAGDADAFDLIWQFTRDELQVRGDDLAAWRWDPNQTPHITDANNASDGDILIAYALALEGETRDSHEMVADARRIADAVGAKNTVRWRGMDLLLPAELGFGRDDQADGPVVNLSYWIFEAFPVLARIAPETNWDRISQDGRRLLVDARFGETELPTDWVALPEGKPQPALGFDAQFGYNSIRIPLYLLRAGYTQPALIGPFVESFAVDPAIVDLPAGTISSALTEPGYRIIGAALTCAADGTKIPEDLVSFSPHSYYGSTLHLLTLSFLRALAPDCL